jgi:hypothetical protein
MKKLIALTLILAATSAFAQTRRPIAQDFASDFQTVPVVANVTGVGGAFFISYLAIFNPTNAAYSVTASFYDAAGTKRDATINLAAGELKTYDNFLQAVFGATGGGAVVFRAPDTAGGTHNNRFIINTEVRSGRYSTQVPVLEFAGSSTRSFAPGISVDSNWRTNVGCFNQAAAAQKVRATVFDSSGKQQVGVAELNLAANGWGQTSINSIVSNGYVQFDPVEDAVCYAVVVDNATNDGRLISSVEYRP